MSVKKRGLGRGLDALLGGMREGQVGLEEADEVTADAPTGGRVTSLPVDLIQRGRFQPRREFDPDSLRELADSIAAQGVIQPIVVRPLGDSRYEIVAGERRWRACQQAGLSEIPVVVRDVDEQSAIAIALIENIQRADLNPLEEAAALQRLLTEFGLTHQQVAEAVGKSRTTVTNLLRLQELNDDVKQYLHDGRLEMGHARALLGLRGPQQTSRPSRSSAADCRFGRPSGWCGICSCRRRGGLLPSGTRNSIPTSDGFRMSSRSASGLWSPSSRGPAAPASW